MSHAITEVTVDIPAKSQTNINLADAKSNIKLHLAGFGRYNVLIFSDWFGCGSQRNNDRKLSDKSPFHVLAGAPPAHCP